MPSCLTAAVFFTISWKGVVVPAVTFLTKNGAADVNGQLLFKCARLAPLLSFSCPFFLFKSCNKHINVLHWILQRENG